MSSFDERRKKRQELMEFMVKTHLITVDLANYHIQQMSEKDIDEDLERYRRKT